MNKLKKEIELDEKQKQIIYCVILVFVLLLLFFGDQIALRFISKNPNPNNQVFGSGEKNNNYQIEFLTELTVEELIKKIKNKEDFIVLSSRDSCETCKKYLPDLKEILKTNQIKGYFVNRDLYKKEEHKELEELDSKIASHFDYTPYLMWFHKGNLLDEIIGKEKKENLELFFNKKEIELLERGEI